MTVNDAIRHYAVLIRELPRGDVARLDLPGKYSAMREHARNAIESIQRSIRSASLEGEVERLGQPTAFNTLFIDATERVARTIRELPEVDRVEEVPDVVLETLGDSDSAQTKQKSDAWRPRR